MHYERDPSAFYTALYGVRQADMDLTGWREFFVACFSTHLQDVKTRGEQGIRADVLSDWGARGPAAPHSRRVRKPAIVADIADASATGVLHGNTITLDAPVPPLEGRRVRVIIAPEDRELALAADEQARLWDEWVRQGLTGPIEDDGEPEFP